MICRLPRERDRSIQNCLDDTGVIMIDRRSLSICWTICVPKSARLAMQMFCLRRLPIVLCMLLSITDKTLATVISSSKLERCIVDGSVRSENPSPRQTGPSRNQGLECDKREPAMRTEADRYDRDRRRSRARIRKASLRSYLPWQVNQSTSNPRRRSLCFEVRVVPVHATTQQKQTVNVEI